MDGADTGLFLRSSRPKGDTKGAGWLRTSWMLIVVLTSKVGQVTEGRANPTIVPAVENGMGIEVVY